MGNRSSSERVRQRTRLGCPSETDITDFQLVAFIGAGTFGKVYSVHHKGMRKEYALKALCKRRLVKRRFGDDVIRELELLQTLTHPFIVNLWFSFQDENYIYMITDLLVGGDLAYHLRQHGRFSESRAKLLICELALALDYLHRQKIGHFDVKLANILLGEEGHAHLGDFSLAKRLDGDQLAFTFSGTRPYMAPEILFTALGQQGGYSVGVDWWALGVCFYELLRGRLPHEYPSNFSSLQVLNIIYTRSVVMPSRWPSDLISFFRSIINPDPERRISTFAELRTHPYMSRMQWKDIFDKKMVPIFSPARNNQQLESYERRRGYRATISGPPQRHRKNSKSRHPLLLHHRHHHFRDQSSDVTGGSESTLLEEELTKLSARFKKYNRFRCEVRPAEPQLSIVDAAASKEKRRLVGDNGRSPQNNNGAADKRILSSGRTTTRADKMRILYQTSNQEVNYSM